MRFVYQISIIYFIVGASILSIINNLNSYVTLNIKELFYYNEIKDSTFLILTTLLLFFLLKFFFKKLEKSSKEKDLIINRISSPIIIYNEEGKVLLVNDAFKKLSSYDYEDVNTVEKWVNLAYGIDAPEMKKVFDSLFEKNEIIDNGEYTLTTKDNKQLIWHFYSAPYGIKDGKKTIISNAYDVTSLKNKDRLLMQQSKMAAMGEILENIAHQWRQPLSTISSAATGIKFQNEFGRLDSKNVEDSMNMINNSAQYLSKTIEDFRSFFRPDQEKEYFNLNYVLDKTLMVIGSKFKDEKINIIRNVEDFQIQNYSNALIQVLINILNNSKDAFIEKNIEKRFIIINVFNNEFDAVIQIKDTAKGIPNKIIQKVFEPYFTTKHKSQGTGVGLYMSEEIVTKHMKGKIKVENRRFLHDGESYSGAMFTITLPLKIN